MAMGHAAGGTCDRSNSLVGAASIAISHLFSSDILRLAGGSNRNLGRFGHTIADSLDSPPPAPAACAAGCVLSATRSEKSQMTTPACLTQVGADRGAATPNIANPPPQR